MSMRYECTYAQFKARVTPRLRVYYTPIVGGATGYMLYAVANDRTFYCTIVDPADIADFDANYKADATTAESEADATIASLVDQNSIDPSPRTSNSSLIIASAKTDSPKVTLYSHDWTDKTTWLTMAARIVDEVPSDLGAGLYGLAHTDVIDTYHGKITGEDFLKDANGFSYRVAVKVNGVAKTEQDPAFGSGGDFTVDYDAGQVQFLPGSIPGGGDTVEVTYHYATTSTFVIKPEAGKRLVIDFVECQFSDDVVFNDSIIFQPYGVVDVFAPQLMPGVPSGTLIPLGDPIMYKTMKDIYNDATRAYPAYPALGGPGWRGSSRPVVVCDWDYVGATVLSSAAQMEIRLYLEHDLKFGGTFATATFYGLSEVEP